jgi:hypothetical protein
MDIWASCGKNCWKRKLECNFSRNIKANHTQRKPVAWNRFHENGNFGFIDKCHCLKWEVIHRVIRNKKLRNSCFMWLCARYKFKTTAFFCETIVSIFMKPVSCNWFPLCVCVCDPLRYWNLLSMTQLTRPVAVCPVLVAEPRLVIGAWILQYSQLHPNGFTRMTAEYLDVLLRMNSESNTSTFWLIDCSSDVWDCRENF